MSRTSPQSQLWRPGTRRVGLPSGCLGGFVGSLPSSCHSRLVRCILDCLSRACSLAPHSFPYYKSFLRRRFGSTAGTAISLSVRFFSSSVVQSIFSLSISRPPLSRNPAFPSQRAPSGLPEPMTQLEQQGPSSALTHLLAMTANNNHSLHAHTLV